jgi:archaetidylinositol phosphate synthase
MTHSSAGLFQRSLKPRPCIELLSQYVYRPFAHLVVVALLPLGVPPTALVLAHTILGVTCGWLVAAGHFHLAAVLIQIKTVLDNADGQLARASGKTSEIGRYADTEGDLLVNTALFAGIAWITGAWMLATVALIALTILLSCDFNAEWLYKRARGADDVAKDTSQENQVVLGALRTVYRVVFLPQDRAIRRASDLRFRSVTKGLEAGQRVAAEHRYHDRLTLWVLANLELTTQLAALGICLWFGKPIWYLWFALIGALTIVPLQLRREFRARQPRELRST